MAKQQENNARLNQDIPFDVKLDIETLNIKVSQHRKKRVNQKDLIVEILKIGTAALDKKLR